MAIAQAEIDPDAQKVIQRLLRGDHQAYLVGGCVRDLLLGRRPKDFDIATSATPTEIRALFRNCRIIGRRFRLAHIFFGAKIIETATFRSNPREVVDADGAGEPAVDNGTEEDLLIRRDNVFGTAEEDARRRDFTINGLFYDLEAHRVIDYVGGLEDLAKRQVRTIGEADIRFREDPVRILRAIKFAARLDFTIEPTAWQAIRLHKGEIPKCAPPRVLEELYRLLRGGAAKRSMELLRETGVLALLLPSLDRLLDGEARAAAIFWSGLERLDAQARGRQSAMPSNALLACLLFGPFAGPELFDDSGEEGPDLGQLFDARVRPLLDEMRVSRRDGERTRQILLSQRRFASPRRRRPMSLVRRDYFEEALAVFELLGPIVLPNLPAEELARWRHWAAGAAHEPPAEPGTADEPRRKRRRRRRGGRRHQRSTLP